jgi:hypothetical protein
LWSSKDKKCCLYKTPYVAAHVRELGEVIARAPPYVRLPIDALTRTGFFWFTRDILLKRAILSNSNANEEVYLQKWYPKGLFYALEEF